MVRTIVYDLLERLSKAVDLPEPVVEFGAARAAGQAHLPPLKSLFPGRDFTGTDMSPGLGVDHLQDLHTLGIRDGSVGTALLIDTIEHVEHPRRALTELARCLKEDGVLLLTSHFFFPIHKFPSDYWRFTAEGIDSLLDGFGRSHAIEAGLQLFPHTVLGLASGPEYDEDNWNQLTTIVDAWRKNGASSWKERAMDWLPPVLVQHGYERYRAAAVGNPNKSTPSGHEAL